ncbi:hypothetical protein BE04_21100 [Sorangium cellulosum]|uniref:Uncharacterized protein n=1 Tax=Sorangium cellulosum TaxID=56 RepID=A0A150Q394_SORCE|nr:hypothetical protein BE04_21100 [Sorangium cellulosum]
MLSRMSAYTIQRCSIHPLGPEKDRLMTGFLARSLFEIKPISAANARLRTSPYFLGSAPGVRFAAALEAARPPERLS